MTTERSNKKQVFMKKNIISVLLLALSTAVSAQQWEDVSLKEVEPQGWIMEYLQTQKSGLTGHPEALCYPYTTNLWDGEIPRMGTHGRDWWRYEQTAYYTDGLIRLGYLIDDKAMIDKAMAGIRYTLDNPLPDGTLGSHKVDISWPTAVFFRAMQAAYNANPSKEMLKALERNYEAYTIEHLAYRRNIISIEGLLWTAARTGNQKLVEKADYVFRNRKNYVGGDQKHRDSRVTIEFLTREKPYEMHGVTMCEILKLPIMLYNKQQLQEQ